MPILQDQSDQTTTPSPILQGAQEAAAAPDRLSELRKGVALGMGGIAAQIWGNAFGQALGDPGLAKTVESAWKDQIAPAIQDRWNKHEADTFKAKVLDPWAQGQQQAFMQYQGKVAQVQRGVVIDPDGKERKVDPFGPEAEQLRSQYAMDLMQGTFSSDQDVIRAATDPAWANNPYIGKSVDALLKARMGMMDQFQGAADVALNNRKKISDVKKDEAQADEATQTTAQNKAKFEEWQTFKGERAEDAKLNLQVKRATINKLNADAAESRAKGGGSSGGKDISIIPKGIKPEDFPNYLLSMKEGRSRLTPYQERLVAPTIQENIENRGMTKEMARAEALKSSDKVDKASVGLYLVDAFGGGNPMSVDGMKEKFPSWGPYFDAAGIGKTEEDTGPKRIPRNLLSNEIEEGSTTGATEIGEALFNVLASNPPAYKNVEEFINDSVNTMVDAWLDKEAAPNPGAQAAKDKLRPIIIKKVKKLIRSSPRFSELMTEKPKSKPSFLSGILHPSTKDLFGK